MIKRMIRCPNCNLITKLTAARQCEWCSEKLILPGEASAQEAEQHGG